MASASAASSGARSRRTGARSGPAGARSHPAGADRARQRPLAARAAAARVRWNRLGRLAMVCVLGALLYLYIGAGLNLLSSWREARQDSAQVEVLERQHRTLEAQHATLLSPGTIDAEARALGMVKPGEQFFVVTGLPHR
ncbi:MAG TPA: septum formation initiator family protein [Solirubrobacteraceae bacterium]|nr:septum formation initiator family protein [Solirubrobacteraceae bacterium]